MLWHHLALVASGSSTRSGPPPARIQRRLIQSDPVPHPACRHSVAGQPYHSRAALRPLFPRCRSRRRPADLRVETPNTACLHDARTYALTPGINDQPSPHSNHTVRSMQYPQQQQHRIGHGTPGSDSPTLQLDQDHWLYHLIAAKMGTKGVPPTRRPSTASQPPVNSLATSSHRPSTAWGNPSLQGVLVERQLLTS